MMFTYILKDPKIFFASRNKIFRGTLHSNYTFKKMFIHNLYIEQLYRRNLNNLVMHMPRVSVLTKVRSYFVLPIMLLAVFGFFYSRKFFMAYLSIGIILRMLLIYLIMPAPYGIYIADIAYLMNFLFLGVFICSILHVKKLRSKTN